MTDAFTIARVTKILTAWKQAHGRDISASELKSNGFSEATIDDLVRSGHICKYQVVAKGGRTENRFKLRIDWRSLNTKSQ